MVRAVIANGLLAAGFLTVSRAGLSA